MRNAARRGAAAGGNGGAPRAGSRPFSAAVSELGRRPLPAARCRITAGRFLQGGVFDISPAVPPLPPIRRRSLRDFTVSGWPESSYSRCQSAPPIPSGRPIRISGPLPQNARGPASRPFAGDPLPQFCPARIRTSYRCCSCFQGTSIWYSLILLKSPFSLIPSISAVCLRLPPL